MINHSTSSQSTSTSKQAGFTFIELILYIGIISLLLVALTGFAWNMVTIQAKSRRVAEMTHVMTNTTQRLAQDIREATAFSTASNILTLTMTDAARNPTVYSVVGGQLKVGMSTTGSCPTSNPCALTPSWLTLATPVFASLNTPTNRHVRMTLTATATGDRQEWRVSQIATVSAQLRTP